MTDEAEVYRQALQEERPQVRHWLCGAHFRRNKIRRLPEIERAAHKVGLGGIVQYARELEGLLRSFPPDGEVLVYRLHRRYLEHPPPKRGQGASLGWLVWRAEGHHPRGE